jgi:hypothetical protein
MKGLNHSLFIGRKPRRYALQNVQSPGSLKAIRKEAAIVAMILGRSAPDPGIGSPVELSGSDARGPLNLVRVGKALSRQGIAAEETPLALLQVEPAGSSGNEDLLEPWMLRQPGAGLSAVVAGKVVVDDEDVARRIVGFDVSEQYDVVRRVARSGALGQLLAIAHAQRSIDPGFFGAAAVIQGRFDAVSIGKPAGRRGKVRGTTGPSTSVQTVVDPCGGSV